MNLIAWTTPGAVDRAAQSALAPGFCEPPEDTFTVTERDVLPPGPVHWSVNVLAVLRVGLCSLPEAAFVPLHAPEAVQPVAFDEVHDSVVRPPEATVVGLAVSVIVGGAEGLLESTVTDAVRVVVPPAPVHASVKVVLAEIEPMFWLPLVALLPAHPPVPPLPTQLVAPLLDQLSVVAPPDGTDEGFAENVTVGAGVAEPTVTVTERDVEPPPEFVHVSVKVVVALSGPRDSLPEVGFEPDQPPEALHDVAFVADHVS